MRKRLLCLLLAGCMLLSSVVPALADNTDTELVQPVTNEEQDENLEESQTLEESQASEMTSEESQTPEATPEVNPVPEVTTEEDSTQDVIPEVSTGSEETSTPETVIDPTKPHVVEYESHVANIGWMDPVSSEEYGVYSGTVGRNLWMESLIINPNGLTGITYRAHVANIGWMDYVSADDEDAFAGTTGRALAMEAIEIDIEGENAELFDIYYRAHVTNFGWLGWAKNGESAGSAGYAYTLQALEIKVLPKGETPEDYDETKDAYKQKFRVFHSAKVQNLGWLAKSESGNVVGTTGRNLYMETIKLNTNGAYGIGIAYSTHVSNIGWTEEVQDGAASGTEGKRLPIEAIKIRLTGENADKYDIYYQAHVSNIGWLDWAKNGEVAGSSGLAYSLQAIRVVVVAKGAAAPGATGFAFATKTELAVQGYSETKGWLATVGSGSVVGTTGKALSLQGLKISLSGVQNTGIKYSAHVSNVGWQSYVSNGAEAGLPGTKEHIEAISIQLTGAGSRYYDIWYRVHSENLGWLDWTKNGELAGTSKLNYAAEAIQVVILPKGSAAPGSTESPFVNTRAGWVYINGYRRYRDEKGNILKDVSHLFNPSNKRITVDCYNGITTVYGYNSATGSYDTPINAFLCSVGRMTDKTPSGTYRIYRKYESKIMNGSDGSYSVWAPYISCFNGTIYFHGVASVGRTPNQIGHGTWAALGSPASSGCVRLAGIEAKWVYYNCPIGTPVYVGSYNQGLACPITNPTRYAWTGGNIGPDPTL